MNLARIIEEGLDYEAIYQLDTSIFGGGNFGTGKNYKYDPTTNTWTSIAAAPFSTYYGGADAINGKIYLAAPDSLGSKSP